MLRATAEILSPAAMAKTEAKGKGGKSGKKGGAAQLSSWQSTDSVTGGGHHGGQQQLMQQEVRSDKVRRGETGGRGSRVEGIRGLWSSRCSRGRDVPRCLILSHLGSSLLPCCFDSGLQRKGND